MRTFAFENVYKIVDDGNERKIAELTDMGFVEIVQESKPVRAEQTEKKQARRGRKGKR